jgi:broad specificity phosphatase PhoE
MAPDAVLYLARHGETDDNAAGRFQGRRNPPLNAAGRAQADVLAREVAELGIVALWASPLRRAAQTAEIVGARLGLEPRFDARLEEVDVGDWAGRSYAEAIETTPDAFDRWRAADPTFRFPGGESLAEQAARVEAALADVRAGRTPALVVCHGGVIRAARQVALGAEALGEVVANGSVHRL